MRKAIVIAIIAGILLVGCTDTKSRSKGIYRHNVTEALDSFVA